MKGSDGTAFVVHAQKPESRGQCLITDSQRSLKRKGGSPLVDKNSHLCYIKTWLIGPGQAIGAGAAAVVFAMLTVILIVLRAITNELKKQTQEVEQMRIDSKLALVTLVAISEHVTVVGTTLATA